MRAIPENWPADVPIPPPIPRQWIDDESWIAEHMTELRRHYPDQWIAVFHEEVIAAGPNLGEVERLAREKAGEHDIATRFVESEPRFYPRWRIL